MLGILVVLLVSWLILWLFERKNLSALGLFPSKKLLTDFIVGFLISTLFCFIYFFSIVKMSGTGLEVSQNFSFMDFLSGFWWTLKSVLLEEFVFRGALLYIGIRKLGIKLACALSAIAFGIYHWFSYGVFGDPMQMVIIFVVTGIGGLMFAYAFAITKSLYLPIGLHLGWNLITVVVFSQGPLGVQLLIAVNRHNLTGILSLVLFLFQLLALPIFTWWYLRRRSGKVSVGLVDQLNS
jgi:membrane protease YdiL (CAAX protease family)